MIKIKKYGRAYVLLPLTIQKNYTKKLQGVKLDLLILTPTPPAPKKESLQY